MSSPTTKMVISRIGSDRFHYNTIPSVWFVDVSLVGFCTSDGFVGTIWSGLPEIKQPNYDV